VSALVKRFCKDKSFFIRKQVFLWSCLSKLTANVLALGAVGDLRAPHLIAGTMF
jgi:hypothetical protein